MFKVQVLSYYLDKYKWERTKCGLWSSVFLGVNSSFTTQLNILHSFFLLYLVIDSHDDDAYFSFADFLCQINHTNVE